MGINVAAHWCINRDTLKQLCLTDQVWNCSRSISSKFLKIVSCSEAPWIKSWVRLKHLGQIKAGRYCAFKLQLSRKGLNTSRSKIGNEIMTVLPYLRVKVTVVPVAAAWKISRVVEISLTMLILPLNIWTHRSVTSAPLFKLKRTSRSRGLGELCWSIFLKSEGFTARNANNFPPSHLNAAPILSAPIANAHNQKTKKPPKGGSFIFGCARSLQLTRLC